MHKYQSTTNNFRTNVSRTKNPNTMVNVSQIFLEQMSVEHMVLGKMSEQVKQF